MRWAELLWGQKSRVIYLLIAASAMLFLFLGCKEIWTQEHRWADIVSGMFFRHDFFHPFLNEVDYYDKPLLSYWLIAGVAFLTGELTTWALRIPSALAGILAVWSIYRLGTSLKDKQLGLLAGWILTTTFYFIFWARTSSADMLNMAGSLFAVAWYFEKKEHPNFFNFSIFFLVLAVTALCKGLVGIIVPLIAIFPDLMMNQTWKKYLKMSLLFACIPAVIIYLLPFCLSSIMDSNHYQESGLYLVYKENILRYFQPFDHQGPIYTYLIFLPVYLLPWAFFLIPAFISLKSRWKNLTTSSKWIGWALLLLFLFFTLSGSRRNYYVLPMVPFAVLWIADWILSSHPTAKRNQLAGWFAIVSFVVMFATYVIVPPLYYAQGGTARFAKEVMLKANSIQPDSKWQYVMLDPESKTRFYLHLSPFVKNYNIAGPTRANQTEESLLRAWPFLKNTDSEVIYISRKQYLSLLQNLLPTYAVVMTPVSWGERLLHIDNPNAPIAFIPLITERYVKKNSENIESHLISMHT